MASQKKKFMMQKSRPKPKPPMVIVPRDYQAHATFDGQETRCGCVKCHPEIWCQDCLREVELVERSLLRVEDSQLLAFKQPRQVGLFNGYGSKDRCRAHNEIAKGRQGNLIGMSEGIAQIAAEAGLTPPPGNSKRDPRPPTLEYPD